MRKRLTDRRVAYLSFKLPTFLHFPSDVDDCLSNPCDQGTCTDGVNSYTCQCTPGYTGDNCDEDVDDCQPNPCVHGTCTDGVNSHTCQCTPGYTGDNCDEDVDDCQPNPCVHGTCTDGV